MSSLEDIMFNIEIRRLEEGLETTIRSNPKSRKNADLRNLHKNKYLNGVFTANKYINAISSTLEKKTKPK